MEDSASVFTALKMVRTVSMSDSVAKLSNQSETVQPIPVTPDQRLLASIEDRPLDLSQLLTQDRNNTTDTVLYLAYGSNLCATVFQGRRNIKPISQINVVVPSLSLTFDLPGIPYSEPCFGNVRNRNTSSDSEKRASNFPNDYHKDRWLKGLVGVVYEVTKSDFAHIIATEGGGSGYQDVLVECYALSSDPTDKVPEVPSNTPFKAHTLFAPTGVSRPNHSYAQPSPRYLKLIADGAIEHALPYEYQDFLHQIRGYHLTTTKQRLGQFIFLSIWLPLFAVIFGAGQLFANPDGTYFPWFAALARAIFTGCWSSYDGYFKSLFGDGERTIGDSFIDDGEISSTDQNAPLIQQEKVNYGTNIRSSDK